MSLLEVKNLSIMFGGLCAVDDFNLSVEKGEVDLSGNIDSVAYSSVSQAGRQNESFFSRLFK